VGSGGGAGGGGGGGAGGWGGPLLRLQGRRPPPRLRLQVRPPAVLPPLSISFHDPLAAAGYGEVEGEVLVVGDYGASGSEARDRVRVGRAAGGMSKAACFAELQNREDACARALALLPQGLVGVSAVFP
jgi:hypothetical protein